MKPTLRDPFLCMEAPRNTTQPQCTFEFVLARFRLNSLGPRLEARLAPQPCLEARLDFNAKQNLHVCRQPLTSGVRRPQATLSSPFNFVNHVWGVSVTPRK